MDQRLSERIAENIEEMIFDGDFEDGERLSEVQLAEKLNVSRTPLREAFQRLSQTGLVELVPRRGAFVREPGPIELSEMFEVMSVLEATCCELAAQRISDEALGELEEANQRCQEAIDAGQADAYYLANERFHQIIYRQSGNGFLEKEALRLQKRLRPFRRIQLRLRGRLQQSMAEHRVILDALGAAESQTAAQAVKDHVAIQGDTFHALLLALREKKSKRA
ncbi:putative HTH-type transcriptional regulator YdfH [Pelagimonas phthalicica]|uniref:Putative HTH-type transcriptional regulator YdfH n=1 Tax=Pelagimonas phthalicica TaxID=1037362 RepID=A0A238JB39_9RHOB|nr:GntR family transcriptional regulator [Pelagimonas phthalicica]TDS93569.1 GntR family transcriptional regulator [Pelagimonas phthalicica]SMX27910.1 putative HTH-type transcriptional regulator YdfH [Pelagimonas phthalicica]